MNNKHCFSGLMANAIPYFKSGMKTLAEYIGADFHSLIFGHLGWEKLADQMAKAYIRGEVKKPFVLCGHSNGVYAAIMISNYLSKYKVPSVVVSIDRTLKWCPPVDKYCVYLQDHHATLAYVDRGKTFEGIHEVFEYPRPKGYMGSWHVGVSSDKILHERVGALLKREQWL